VRNAITCVNRARKALPLSVVFGPRTRVPHRHHSCIDQPRKGEKATPVMRARFAPCFLRGGARAVALYAMSTLLPASVGCDTEDAACSWLFAPESFVDAARAGCTVEPAGQTCDRSKGLCVNICGPNEYLLTCRTEVDAGATSIEAPQDPIVGAGDRVKCTHVQLSSAPPNEATFCCQCAPSSP
jgi:hypothetical protein